MQAVCRRCAGLDVHKETITATVLVFDDEGRRQVRTKQFGTYWKQRQALAQWLRASLVEQVVMESTGVSWKPVWNVLEKTLHLVLANPCQVKNIPAGKTDRRDSVWLADLLAHGLVRSSFVPPQPIRHWRDLTRYRVQLTRQHARVRNRIEKVLEDASIKLDTVVSDLPGVSARALLGGMLRGHHGDPGWLADYAQTTLRAKREERERALRGQVLPHHLCLLALPAGSACWVS